MNWADLALILIWVLFLALGARLGSLWTGACILGGFFGAAVADTYTASFMPFLGSFAGAHWVAQGILFLGGLLVFVIPGAILSRIGSVLFMGIIDSAFGFFTGAFTGLVLIAVGFFIVTPFFPRFERSSLYKGSMLLKPLHHTVDELFYHSSFNIASSKKMIEHNTVDKLKPLTDKAKDSLRGFKHAVHEINS